MDLNAVAEKYVGKFKTCVVCNNERELSQFVTKTNRVVKLCQACRDKRNKHHETYIKRTPKDERCDTCGLGPTERDLEHGGMERIRQGVGTAGTKITGYVYTCERCICGPDLLSSEVNEMERARIMSGIRGTSAATWEAAKLSNCARNEGIRSRPTRAGR